MDSIEQKLIIEKQSAITRFENEDWNARTIQEMITAGNLMYSTVANLNIHRHNLAMA